jgi:hypothetical protein
MGGWNSHELARRDRAAELSPRHGRLNLRADTTVHKFVSFYPHGRLKPYTP